MIDLNEAIKIFHNYIKGSIIGGVADVGHSFVFWESDEEGEALDTAATAINKTTGEISAILPDDEDEFENIIKIDYTEINHS